MLEKKPDFLRKKSPCGHAGDETGLFEEKKAPAGTLVAKPGFCTHTSSVPFVCEPKGQAL